MTIAQKLNDIAKEQGGTPSADGTIASAIDALNDALAGSDQPAAQTIEAAVALLGQHIGGGGGVANSVSLGIDDDRTVTWLDTSYIYPAVEVDGYYEIDTSKPAVTSASAGDILGVDVQGMAAASLLEDVSAITLTAAENGVSPIIADAIQFMGQCFPMPSTPLSVIVYPGDPK